MRKKTMLTIGIASSLIFVSSKSSTYAQVATTPEPPTMGWSSWNTFGVNINESVIKTQAAKMKSSGLLKAGYKYINIDDGYFGGRDKEGNLLIHPTRFPNGLAPVVRYIHNMGMKAGIYSDAGKNTCGSYFNGDKIGEGVGLYQHDQQDADLFFKELGFDFIKVDFCGGSYYHNKDHFVLSEEQRYKAISEAIKNTGRTDVRLNVCRWAYPGTWVHDIACSWRTTGDINCSWKSVKDILAENMYLSAYATGGHFNDMDMLEIGRGLSTEEDKTHFGMWCIMSSPLLIGCNLTELKANTLSLLKNPELIALNQDSLCIQAYVVQHKNDTYVLVKDVDTLYSNTRAVALYNPTDKEQEMEIKFSDLDLAGNVKVRDLFEKNDMEDRNEKLNVTVPAHGTRIFKLTAEQRLERALYEAETAYLSSYQELTNNQVSKTAIYEESSICSGNAYASWLGCSNNNDLQWRNVYSKNGGKYTMKVRYVSGESRYLFVQVNDGNQKRFSTNSGSWNQAKEFTMDIELQPGENTIRLFNKTNWMANIDCMTLTYVGPTGIDNIKSGKNKNDKKVFNLNGIQSQDDKTLNKGKIIIKGNKKYFVK